VFSISPDEEEIVGRAGNQDEKEQQQVLAVASEERHGYLAS
jgi:hypothetical protein